MGEALVCGFLSEVTLNFTQGICKLNKFPPKRHVLMETHLDDCKLQQSNYSRNILFF